MTKTGRPEKVGCLSGDRRRQKATEMGARRSKAKDHLYFLVHLCTSKFLYFPEVLLGNYEHEKTTN